MREIKFRCWDYQNNKWATNNDVAGIVGLVFGIKDYFINIVGEKALRFSFQQYTGLKDKNGVDIYEGDVLAFTSAHPRHKDKVFNNVVEYFVGSSMAGYRMRNKSTIVSLNKNRMYRAEIIGNIHENPELLKQTPSSFSPVV